MKVYIIITVVKVIWVVLIVHQSILQIMRRTYKHTLLMKMVILIMTIWILLILILLFSLLKQMEALITSLIIRVLKKSYWYLRLYEERMLTLVPKIMCLIDNTTIYTIIKSNKFFSCLIMRDINVSIIYNTTNIFEGSRRAIILLSRSWIETY